MNEKNHIFAKIKAKKIMKQYFLSFYLLLTTSSIAVVFNSYSRDEPEKENPKTTDAGVVINDVRWATRNVDMPGIFAENLESLGMFYQWGRNIAWSADVNADVSDWNNSFYTGDTWTRANDPCPQGWRVPTDAELQTLTDTNYVTSEWTTVNDVSGRIFTDINTNISLFLPAAGFRSQSNGSLNRVGTWGCYWSSTVSGANARHLGFGSGGVTVGTGYRAWGFSVRCVAE